MLDRVWAKPVQIRQAGWEQVALTRCPLVRCRVMLWRACLNTGRLALCTARSPQWHDAVDRDGGDLDRRLPAIRCTAEGGVAAARRKPQGRPRGPWQGVCRLRLVQRVEGDGRGVSPASRACLAISPVRCFPALVARWHRDPSRDQYSACGVGSVNLPVELAPPDVARWDIPPRFPHSVARSPRRRPAGRAVLWIEVRPGGHPAGCQTSRSATGPVERADPNARASAKPTVVAALTGRVHGTEDRAGQANLDSDSGLQGWFAALLLLRTGVRPPWRHNCGKPQPVDLFSPRPRRRTSPGQRKPVCCVRLI